MKPRITRRPLFTFIGAVLLYLGCVSGIAAEGENETQSPAGSRGGTPVNETRYPDDRRLETPARSIHPNSGEGGSITIMEPVGRNLQPDDAHLPSLVQNAVSGDFTRYSAMAVMNWNDLFKVMEELESMVYSGNDNFVQAGNITQTDYIMTGDLTRAGTSYVLNLVVTDAKTGMNKASYLKTVSLAELSSLAAVKAASADLLTQMGTTLAAADRTSLLQADAARTIQAETALAKGQTAQRNGQTVAAMNWYAQAVDFQPGLAEAETRLAALTRQISSYDILGDLQRRFAWKKLLDEAIAFYQQNPCYNMVCQVPEIGKIDYAKNTAELRYVMWMEPNAGYAAMLKIALALNDTGKVSEWDFSKEFNLLFLQGSYSYGYRVPVKIVLVDEYGEQMMNTKRDFQISCDLRKADNPRSTTTAKLGADRFSFTVDATRISNGMRLQCTIERDPPGIYELPVILTDKTRREYYQGKQNVNAQYGFETTFTFK